ncbi:glutaredoxin family protein [Aliibacillus thermotolerans]|uniref:Glutaredoxin family protein n=1 Tax=Aliibacillus thermotolerans TaxID=1834418 RepID=A0ABW0U2H7_9BACI|nr:glutaredoxin domain-containing protein [Aliibacillus thermotolerans]MDA3128520.1 glutaredoxin family protein [Aliibacillus thermotolerans]
MNVTVYTTTTCPYCDMVKSFLSQNNIPYKEVNVEDMEKMQQLVQKTGQMGVPQTNVNGTWILGFDPNGIMAALK